MCEEERGKEGKETHCGGVMEDGMNVGGLSVRSLGVQR